MSGMLAGRTVLFGGSFNPPHVGHVGLVRHLLDRIAPGGEVWILPTHTHPFGKPLAPFGQRLAMCRLAFEPIAPAVRIIGIEADLAKPNRTVDTVEALRRLHPGRRFALAVGSDLKAEAHKWKDFDRLESMIEVVNIPRAGWESAVPTDRPAPLLPEISSTQLRDRLARGEMPADWLPGPVVDYIRRNGLYGWREIEP